MTTANELRDATDPQGAPVALTKDPRIGRPVAKRKERPVALITGGTAGLGLELAKLLHDEEYAIIVTSRLPVLGDWPYGRQVFACYRVDAGFVAASSAPPEVDLLVNNVACAGSVAAIEDVDDDEWTEAFGWNVSLPFALIRRYLPGMKERNEGTIINICSYAGRRAIPYMGPYCASKFALRGLTETVAKELAKEPGCKVRCFSVSPGGMNTGTRQDLFQDAAQQQDPALVAGIIQQAIGGAIGERGSKGCLITSGVDIVIRNGKAEIRLPEA